MDTLTRLHSIKDILTKLDSVTDILVKLHSTLEEAAYTALLATVIGLVALIFRSFCVKIYFLFGKKFGQFVEKLTFIGFLHHELSYLFFAFITGAKVHRFKLFNRSGNDLTHSYIIPRGPSWLKTIQACFCRLVPVICGATLYAIYYFGFYTRPIFDAYSILLIILAMQISYHMDTPDINLTSVIKVCFILYIILAVIIWCEPLWYKSFKRIFKDFIMLVAGVMSLNVVVAILFGLILAIGKLILTFIKSILASRKH